MKPKKIEGLHCGACMRDFNSIGSLSEHLKEDCPEASCLLPIIHLVSFGGDKSGHPMGHFVYCFRKSVKQNLIKRYAYSVADEISYLERARLHKELCDVLEFKYKEFRPFESSDITELMTRTEALKYLCRKIFEYAHTLK